MELIKCFLNFLCFLTIKQQGGRMEIRDQVCPGYQPGLTHNKVQL